MNAVEMPAGLLWVGFVVVWQLLAWWTARVVKPTSSGAQVGWFLAYAVAFGLLFAPYWQAHVRIAGVNRPLWTAPLAVDWLLFGLEAAGFAFAFWARAHIGRLWSGALTLREGHRVVDTGPYRLVRHPIYTGFLAGAWMLAFIGAEPERLLGALALTAVMGAKAKVEERLLRTELGEGAYDAYAARTPMLVPFSPR